MRTGTPQGSPNKREDPSASSGSFVRRPVDSFLTGGAGSDAAAQHQRGAASSAALASSAMVHHPNARAVSVAWPDDHPDNLEPAHADRRADLLAQFQLQPTSQTNNMQNLHAAHAPEAHILQPLRAVLPLPASTGSSSSTSNSPGLAAQHEITQRLQTNTTSLLASFNSSTGALTPAKAKLNSFILDLVKNQIKITDDFSAMCRSKLREKDAMLHGLQLQLHQLAIEKDTLSSEYVLLKNELAQVKKQHLEARAENARLMQARMHDSTTNTSHSSSSSHAPSFDAAHLRHSYESQLDTALARQQESYEQILGEMKSYLQDQDAEMTRLEEEIERIQRERDQARKELQEATEKAARRESRLESAVKDAEQEAKQARKALRASEKEKKRSGCGCCVSTFMILFLTVIFTALLCIGLGLKLEQSALAPLFGFPIANQTASAYVAGSSAVRLDCPPCKAAAPCNAESCSPFFPVCPVFDIEKQCPKAKDCPIPATTGAAEECPVCTPCADSKPSSLDESHPLVSLFRSYQSSPSSSPYSGSPSDELTTLCALNAWADVTDRLVKEREEKENAPPKGEDSKELLSQKADLESQLASLQKRLDSVEAENGELKDKLADAQTEAKLAKAAAEAEINAAKIGAEAASATKDDAGADSPAVSEELSELKATHEGLRLNYETLVVTLEDTVRELNMMRNATSLLGAAADEANNATALLQAELEAEKNATALLQIELDASKKETATLQSQLDLAEEKQLATEKEIQHLLTSQTLKEAAAATTPAAKVEDAEEGEKLNPEELSTAAASVIELRASTTALQADLSKLTSSYDALEVEKQELEQENALLQEQLNQWAGNATLLEEKVAACEALVVSIRNESAQALAAEVERSEAAESIVAQGSYSANPTQEETAPPPTLAAAPAPPAVATPPASRSPSFMILSDDPDDDETYPVILLASQAKLQLTEDEIAKMYVEEGLEVPERWGGYPCPACAVGAASAAAATPSKSEASEVDAEAAATAAEELATLKGTVSELNSTRVSLQAELDAALVELATAKAAAAAASEASAASAAKEEKSETDAASADAAEERARLAAENERLLAEIEQLRFAASATPPATVPEDSHVVDSLRSELERLRRDAFTAESRESMLAISQQLNSPVASVGSGGILSTFLFSEINNMGLIDQDVLYEPENPEDQSEPIGECYSGTDASFLFEIPPWECPRFIHSTSDRPEHVRAVMEAWQEVRRPFEVVKVAQEEPVAAGGEEKVGANAASESPINTASDFELATLRSTNDALKNEIMQLKVKLAAASRSTPTPAAPSNATLVATVTALEVALKQRQAELKDMEDHVDELDRKVKEKLGEKGGAGGGSISGAPELQVRLSTIESDMAGLRDQVASTNKLLKSRPAVSNAGGLAPPAQQARSTSPNVPRTVEEAWEFFSQVYDALLACDVSVLQYLGATQRIVVILVYVFADVIVFQLLLPKTRLWIGLIALLWLGAAVGTAVLEIWLATILAATNTVLALMMLIRPQALYTVGVSLGSDDKSSAKDFSKMNGNHSLPPPQQAGAQLPPPMMPSQQPLPPQQQGVLSPLPPLSGGLQPARPASATSPPPPQRLPMPGMPQMPSMPAPSASTPEKPFSPNPPMSSAPSQAAPMPPPPAGANTRSPLMPMMPKPSAPAPEQSPVVAQFLPPMPAPSNTTVTPPMSAKHASSVLNPPMPSSLPPEMDAMPSPQPPLPGMYYTQGSDPSMSMMNPPFLPPLSPEASASHASASVSAAASPSGAPRTYQSAFGTEHGSQPPSQHATPRNIGQSFEQQAQFNQQPYQMQAFPPEQQQQPPSQQETSAQAQEQARYEQQYQEQQQHEQEYQQQQQEYQQQQAEQSFSHENDTVSELPSSTVAAASTASDLPIQTPSVYFQGGSEFDLNPSAEPQQQQASAYPDSHSQAYSEADPHSASGSMAGSVPQSAVQSDVSYEEQFDAMSQHSQQHQQPQQHPSLSNQSSLSGFSEAVSEPDYSMPSSLEPTPSHATDGAQQNGFHYEQQQQQQHGMNGNPDLYGQTDAQIPPPPQAAYPPQPQADYPPQQPPAPYAAPEPVPAQQPVVSAVPPPASAYPAFPSPAEGNTAAAPPPNSLAARKAARPRLGFAAAAAAAAQSALPVYSDLAPTGGASFPTPPSSSAPPPGMPAKPAAYGMPSMPPPQSAAGAMVRAPMPGMGDADGSSMDGTAMPPRRPAAFGAGYGAAPTSLAGRFPMPSTAAFPESI